METIGDRVTASFHELTKFGLGSRQAGNLASLPTPTTEAPTTFELFPKLAIELRLTIWKLSCEEQRLVEVRFAPRGKAATHEFIANYPAILGTCREARTEGLKHYTLSFQSTRSLNAAWFNFDADVLYLRPAYGDQLRPFIKNLPSKELIQRLAVPAHNHLCPVSWGVGITQLFFHQRPYRRRRRFLGSAQPLIFKFEALKELSFLKILDQEFTDCATCFPKSLPYERTLVIDEKKVRDHLLHRTLPFRRLEVFVGDYLGREKLIIQEFLLQLQAKILGDVEWHEPQFKYGGVNEERISVENIHCLPQGKNRHSTRSQTRARNT